MDDVGRVWVRVWTLQAPEVVAALRDRGRYRASWERVVVNWRPAYRAMVGQMERSGIACGDAPPVWCWPGRALRRGRVRMTADLLLGDDQWAHGVCLLRLTVPPSAALATSYARWNDYLGETMALLAAAGRSDGPAFGPDEAAMDWRGVAVDAWDATQIVLPELRSEWLVGVRHYPPGADTAARIAADPELRALAAVDDGARPRREAIRRWRGRRYIRQARCS
ncbi:hypothetical protein AB0H49_07505 [Nocardia sp. NPDC050713]|uniref:hypothetical protein n=1 Tax=Nocardia sp. NPDC050713 TaxID=3154511 RepID=UPI0033FD50A1